jgi:hypothetical protein
MVVEDCMFLRNDDIYLHGAKTQNNIIIITAAKTSNLTISQFKWRNGM